VQRTNEHGGDSLALEMFQARPCHARPLSANQRQLDLSVSSNSSVMKRFGLLHSLNRMNVVGLVLLISQVARAMPWHRLNF
jgi:hypothetical protein